MNIVANRLPKRRPTETPTARANCLGPNILPDFLVVEVVVMRDILFPVLSFSTEMLVTKLLFLVIFGSCWWITLSLWTWSATCPLFSGRLPRKFDSYPGQTGVGISQAVDLDSLLYFTLFWLCFVFLFVPAWVKLISIVFATGCFWLSVFCLFFWFFEPEIIQLLKFLKVMKLLLFPHIVKNQ